MKSPYRAVKSLCGEIRLRRVKDGFNFTVSVSERFHQRRKTLISPRQRRDFTIENGFLLCYDMIEVITLAESKLSELSMDFAVNVLKLCDSIKGHYSLINQLERSATSIGANIREANYAHSKADFVSKLQISLKECYETEYWLELLERSKLVSSESLSHLIHDCGSIRRMLVASVNTAKSKIIDK